MPVTDSFQTFFNSDLVFIYLLSFIILLTLIFELLNRLIFPQKGVSMAVALIITGFVFLSKGFELINRILSLGAFGMVAIFVAIILIVMFSRFRDTLRRNWI